MPHVHKVCSPSRFASLALGTVVLLAGQVVLASGPACKKVHARFFVQAETTPTCGSTVGLCASGVLYGSLAGTAAFVGTSSTSSVDTPSTGVIMVTGDDRIDTGDGVLYLKDAVLLKTTGGGELAEVDEVVGGSGRWAGATGTLTATGTFIDGTGEGLLTGEICIP